MNYIFDAHVLFWCLFAPEKISQKVKNIFADIEQGKINGIIPTIVLSELLFLLEKKKIDVDFNDIIEGFDSKPGFIFAPFDKRQLLMMPELRQIPEMHDRIIVACSLIYSARIVTKDREITEFSPISVVW